VSPIRIQALEGIDAKVLVEQFSEAGLTGSSIAGILASSVGGWYHTLMSTMADQIVLDNKGDIGVYRKWLHRFEVKIACAPDDEQQEMLTTHRRLVDFYRDIEEFRAIPECEELVANTISAFMRRKYARFGRICNELARTKSKADFKLFIAEITDLLH
jgi:hypothetical protein